MTVVFFAAALVALWYVSNQLEEQGSAVVNVDPASSSGSAAQQLAYAIALAENGPTRINARNNPGNIRDGCAGQICSYPDPVTGWQHLYNKLDFDLIAEFDGRLPHSMIYHPSMSFQEFAWMWVNGTTPGDELVSATDHPDNWASVVSGQLGFSPADTISDYLSSVNA